MPPHSNEDDLTALREVITGGKLGEKALERLYRAHRPQLLGYLRKRGMDMAEAEDVVQNVFVQVIHKAHTFRGESAVSSWLFQIAHHAMVDMFRATNREIQFDDDGWDALSNSVPADFQCPMLPDPKKALQECFEKAYMAFAKAHPAAADLVYRMLQNQDWSGQDMAQYLGRSAGAAREYFSQCKKKLKQYVEPCRQFLGQQP